MTSPAKATTATVAVVQAGSVLFDPSACVDKAVRLIGEAAATGAKIVLFPEAFITGYPKGLNYGLVVGARDAVGREEFRLYLDAAIEVPGSETERLGEAAAANGTYVVMGAIERELGTCYCTVLFFGPDGRFLGKHRKLVPTFPEKMVWSRGDGSGMRVWETDIGRLGTLACGENSNTLARFALLAQGEQVHVANYPALGLSTKLGQNTWIHLRAGAHSCEGKVFTLVSTSTINQEMIEMLGDTEGKRQFLSSANAYSAIYGPNGEVLTSIEGKEGIIYAEIDIEQEIIHKQWHDITGHYNRFDVLSLNLNMDEDQPINFITRRPPSPDSDLATTEAMIKLLEQSQAEQQELRKAIGLLSQRLGEEGK